MASVFRAEESAGFPSDTGAADLAGEAASVCVDESSWTDVSGVRNATEECDVRSALGSSLLFSNVLFRLRVSKLEYNNKELIFLHWLVGSTLFRPVAVGNWFRC